MTAPSGGLSVDVRPGRGGEIAQIRFEGQEILAAWPAPGPKPAGQGFEASQTTWLETYRGGWQELIPNSGAASAAAGVWLSFHGSASHTPWRLLSHVSDRTVLEHWVNELPLSIQRTIAVSDAEVSVVTTVSNVGTRVATLLWGHHPAFRWTAGAVAFPEGEDCPPLDLDTLGQSHLKVRNAGKGVAVLRHPDGLRIELSWSPREFPYMWVWSERDPPSWPFPSGVELISFEPQTSSRPDGIHGAQIRGEALECVPGSSISRSVRLRVSRDTVRNGTDA